MTTQGQLIDREGQLECFDGRVWYREGDQASLVRALRRMADDMVQDPARIAVGQPPGGDDDDDGGDDGDDRTIRRIAGFRIWVPRDDSGEGAAELASRIGELAEIVAFSPQRLFAGKPVWLERFDGLDGTGNWGSTGP